MNRAIPPFPNMPSWRGDQLKHRGSFTLPNRCSVVLAKL